MKTREGDIVYCDTCRALGAPSAIVPPPGPGEMVMSCGHFAIHHYDRDGGTAFIDRNSPYRGLRASVPSDEPFPPQRPDKSGLGRIVAFDEASLKAAYSEVSRVGSPYITILKEDGKVYVDPVDAIPSEADRRAEVALPEPFEGYPYLVTRIGHSAMRHMAVLPADWPRERLLDLARRQAEANQLETCLCLGPSEAVFFTPDGKAVEGVVIPIGIPVVEALALVEPVPQTEEVAARRLDLHAYAEQLNPGGYQVGDGLEGGRPATPADIDRLSRQGPDGVPTGLTRCMACRWFRGDYLALNGEGDGDLTPRVIRVHCRCENHNRCAGCGQTLADWRLSAYSYDEANRSVRYLAAYSAFSHRCR